MNDYYLRCISCGKIYSEHKDLYWCSSCGSLKGTLEIIYDYDNLKIKRGFSHKGDITQFADLLPVHFQTDMDEYVGGTPLFKFRNKFGVKDFMIKFDGISLSGSYKDRASIIAINKAIEYGIDTIFCASTGNAASSLAILSAHTDLKTYIFVPNTIPRGKLAQLNVAGAEVIAIEGSYDEAYDISLEVGLNKGWYCRNSAVNPYLLEGKKTGAYEIIVQNDYEVPDYCFVGVGDGTVISALCKGFGEFQKIGFTEKMPKIIGVQAEGASTLKKVYERGKPYKPIEEKVYTVADSIAVGNPRDVIKACKYMEESGGEFITVTDDEIIKGIREMTEQTGIFAEPAGAAPYAGFRKLQLEGKLGEECSVCIVATGNGLKDISAVEKLINRRTYSKDEARKI